MGAVWLAWDRRTETYVAAKVLQQRDSASLLRFTRERAVRIEDPQVVTPLGWSGEDDRMLFTIPLVRGGSVATLLGDHGSLPQRWVRELLRQLLAALAAVHRAGVVHRDVKPANLLLDPTGTARPSLRLTDFGIALPVDGPRLTRTDVVVGTAGFLPPLPSAEFPAGPGRTEVLAGRAPTLVEPSTRQAGAGMPPAPLPGAAEPVPSTAEPPPAGATPLPAGPRGRRRSEIAAAAVVVTVLVGALLVLRPWSGPSTPTPGTTSQTGAPTRTPEPTGSQTGVAPPASVPVVTQSESVGQACTFADVGVRQIAPDGRAIACERQRTAPTGGSR